MAITIVVALKDDAPPLPFDAEHPLEAKAVLDNEGMETIVVSGVVDRAMLQSYLMMATEPLADDYETQLAAGPLTLEELETEPGEEPQVTPPPEPPRLPLTLANWNYLKPDGATPLSGEIVHGNLSKGTLSISVFDADANDQTPVLELVRAGDFIGVDITTWTVMAAAYQSGGWFEFLVEPMDQAAVTGVVEVSLTPAPEIPPVVIPPADLPPTTLLYDYLKTTTPEEIRPANGQIIHSNLAVDGLRVSFFDAAAGDQTDLLGLVIPGDRISVGTSPNDTVWTVNLVNQTVEWVDFMVSPAQQHSESGPLLFTFERPTTRHIA